MRNKRTTITISLEAKSQLDTVRSLGQSYDGIIEESVKFWKEKNKEYWTVRQEQTRQRRVFI